MKPCWLTRGVANYVSGTDEYSGLHGGGSLLGIPIGPGTGILDVYDGKVH